MTAAKLCGPSPAELVDQVAEAGLRLELIPPDRLRLLGSPNPPAEILATLRKRKPQVLALLTLRAAEHDPEHWACLDTWAMRMSEHDTLEHRRAVTREWLVAAGGPELLDRLPPTLAAVRLRRLVREVPGVLEAPIAADPLDLAVDDCTLADPVRRTVDPPHSAGISSKNSGLPAGTGARPSTIPTGTPKMVAIKTDQRLEPGELAC